MKEQAEIDFHRIAKAIDFIRDNFKSQPSLEDIARQVHLSPYHFQRMFKSWAGVSPKQFLQYISLNYAKELLVREELTLFDTADETGLSGTSRLHDLFIKIEGMTPGDYKNGGERLVINYSFAASPFGKVLVASTTKGICHLVFVDHEATALSTLIQRFPRANFQQMTDLLQQKALSIFTKDWDQLDEVKLYLKGTDFQLRVWEALLKIPSGGLSTYGQIAQQIEQPKASRAVGRAIGSNPVAYLIPCHRVIRSSGVFGNYRWNANRKTAIIGWEAARINGGE